MAIDQHFWVEIVALYAGGIETMTKRSLGRSALASAMLSLAFGGFLYAQPKLSRDQEALRNDLRAYLADANTLDAAAHAQLGQSWGHVRDWISGQANDALTGAMAISDPVAFAQRLIRESVPVYEAALRGDWSKWQMWAIDVAIKEGGTHAHLDPTIVSEAFDLANVLPLREMATQLDARARELLARQRALAGRDAKKTASTKKPGTGPALVATVPRDYAELDDAIADIGFRELGFAWFDGRPEAEKSFLQKHAFLGNCAAIAENLKGAESSLAWNEEESVKTKGLDTYFKSTIDRFVNDLIPHIKQQLIDCVGATR